MIVPTVSAQGLEKIRRKPESLLMMGTLKANGATLELALVDLRKQCDATSKWLERLQAKEVEFGTPRFPDQVEPTPMSVVRQRMGTVAPAVPASTKEVIVAYTAEFTLDDMMPDDVLVFADRLRFELTDSADSKTETAGTPTFDSAENIREHMESVMARMSGDAEVDDGSVHFLFRSQLPSQEEKKATAAAFANARTKAEILASAAGLQLGSLQSISQFGSASTDPNTSMKRMQRQTLMPSLGETSYGTDEYEILSESPRPNEFCVTVNVVYELTQPSV